MIGESVGRRSAAINQFKNRLLGVFGLLFRSGNSAPLFFRSSRPASTNAETPLRSLFERAAEQTLRFQNGFEATEEGDKKRTRKKRTGLLQVAVPCRKQDDVARMRASVWTPPKRTTALSQINLPYSHSEISGLKGACLSSVRNTSKI